ncbi:hypothetical protein [Rhodanobacter sp. UC4436_H3]
MTERSPTAILIVGMHRSGTSALAGLVGKLGIPLGDHLLEAGSDNPKGYWEHQDVVLAHERLLRKLGSRWDDVRALPVDWLGSEAAREASKAIEEIISRDFSAGPVWALKDPRLCRVLPLWLEVLQKMHIRPVLLFMVRRPSEVSASIEARNQWHPLVGKLLWLRYMAEAIEASSASSREVLLYDDVLADPIASVTTAFSRLGIKMGKGVSVQQRKAAVDFVDASDRHHVTHDVERPASTIEVIAEKLYEAMVVVARSGHGWDAADKAVSDFTREWSKSGACVDAVADMAARIEANLQITEVKSSQLSSALIAQTRWSDDAQAKYEALQAQNAEALSKLDAQIRWSDEAQAKYEALQAQNAEALSKLDAQIRWSDEAQAKYEALQAQNAEALSKLNAWMRWSDETRAKCEALQAEKAEISSKLDAQMLQSEYAQTKCEALQAENGELSSKLSARALQVQEAQVKYEALLRESAELSSKLAAQIRQFEDVRAKHEGLMTEHADLAAQLLGYTRKCERLELDLEAARINVRDLSAGLERSEGKSRRLTEALNNAVDERDRIAGELERTSAAKLAIASELRSVYASGSWRVTKPLRFASSFFSRRDALANSSTRKPQ